MGFLNVGIIDVLAWIIPYWWRGGCPVLAGHLTASLASIHHMLGEQIPLSSIHGNQVCLQILIRVGRDGEQIHSQLRTSDLKACLPALLMFGSRTGMWALWKMSCKERALEGSEKNVTAWGCYWKEPSRQTLSGTGVSTGPAVAMSNPAWGQSHPKIDPTSRFLVMWASWFLAVQDSSILFRRIQGTSGLCSQQSYKWCQRTRCYQSPGEHVHHKAESGKKKRKKRR